MSRWIGGKRHFDGGVIGYEHLVDGGDLGAPDPENPGRTYDGTGNMDMPWWFEVSVLERNKRVVGSAGTSTVNDRSHIYQQAHEATVIDDYVLIALPALPMPMAVKWSSSNLAIATVDTAGGVGGVSPGTVVITATTPFLSRSISLDITESSGLGPLVLTGLQPGSAAAAAADEMTSRTTGKSVETAKSIFSTQNHADKIYVRNSACWAYGLDLTAISPWNSAGGPLEAGVLVTPRHIVYARHFPIANGATVRFVSSGNAVVERTQITSGPVGDINGSYVDFQVGVLDADVPGTIGFAKVLPTNFRAAIPIPEGIPILGLDQEEKALTLEWRKAISNTMMLFGQTTAGKAWAPFFEPIVGGDSGNPAFIILNGHIIFLTTWYGINGSPFVFVAGSDSDFCRSALNATITALDLSAGSVTGYTLTPADFSTFNQY